MIKRYIAMIAAFILTISLFPLSFVQNAYAYQNNAYFSDVKVGLVTMSAANLTVTLNGDYSLNGQAYPSGSIIKLSVNGPSILMNGVPQSQISLIPNDKTNLLTITSGSVTNKYMGSFIIKIYNGSLLPINSIDIESYLKGVVGYEMSDPFPIEALKAQTVAARNYALSRIGWESAKGYDFDDSTNYQVYKGYNPSYANVINAVDQTKGQVLLYNDKLVETLYSAWHGGVSEDSENVWGNVVPYLRSVVDPYENDPWPNGNRVLTNSQIQTTLATKGYLSSTDTFIKLDLTSITRFSSGRVSNINVIYKNSSGLTLTKSVTKDSTRTFLAFPSNLYNVVYDQTAGAYTFSGKGNGHGLGMSQIGAKNRAAAGQTYDQILKFYYQNTYLQNLILKASLNSVAVSKGSMLVQDNETLSASASGGNGLGYLYKFVIKNGSGTLLTRDYNTDQTFTYTPTQPGNYSVDVYVKDKFSISDYDDKNTISFTAFSLPTITAFTKDVTNVFAGDNVNFTASVSGGSNKGTSYKYVVLRDGQTIYTSDFSPSNKLSYTPSIPGNYKVDVYAVDSISVNNYDAVKSINFTVLANAKLSNVQTNKTKYLAGQTINLNVSGILGSGSYLYKYEIAKDGTALTAINYTTSGSIQYIAASPGNYALTVYIKDALSKKAYDDTASLNIPVYSQPSMTLTSSQASSLVGKSTNYNITVINGSGNAQYRFSIIKNGSQVSDSGYQTSNIYDFTPSIDGTYQITGYLKDALSEKAYDVQNTVNLDVYNPQLTNATVTGSYYEGKPLYMSVNTTGASPSGFSYKYEVYLNGVLTAGNSFNPSSAFNFTPSVAGNYTIKIYGKDGLSTNTYDCTKQFILLVNTKPLYLSTLPLSVGMTSSDVTSLQNALIKLGYPISSATGYFGSQTKSAVVSFQTSKGLSADGVVGNTTYGALNDVLINKDGTKSMNY